MYLISVTAIIIAVVAVVLSIIKSNEIKKENDLLKKRTFDLNNRLLLLEKNTGEDLKEIIAEPLISKDNKELIKEISESSDISAKSTKEMPLPENNSKVLLEEIESNNEAVEEEEILSEDIKTSEDILVKQPVIKPKESKVSIVKSEPIKAAEKKSVTVSRNSIIERIVENWSGSLGVVFLVMGFAFLGIVAAFKVSAFPRFLLLTLFSAIHFIAGHLLHKKKKWLKIALWLKSASGAIFLFACIASSSGIAPLTWVYSPIGALLLLVAGIGYNVYLGYRSKNQYIAAVHVFLILLSLSIAPAESAVLIVGTLVTILGISLTLRKKWDINLLLIIVLYSLFHLYWNIRYETLTGSSSALGLISMFIVFIVSLSSHYRHIYSNKTFQQIPFFTHFINWISLSLGIYLYFDIIPFKVLFLGLGALTSLFIARKARAMDIRWLYITDTLVGKLLAIIAIISLYGRNINPFLVTTMLLFESVIFLIVTVIEKEKLLSKIAYIISLVFGFYLLFVNFLYNVSWNNLSGLEFIRSISLLLLASSLGFLYYTGTKKLHFFKAVDKKLNSLFSVIILLYLFTLYLNNFKALWSPFLLLILSIPIIYFRERIKNSNLIIFLYIISGMFNLFSWLAARQFDTLLKVLYLLPSFALSIYLIKGSFNYKLKKYNNLPGFIITNINLIVSLFIVLEGYSPFLIGGSLLVLTILSCEVSQLIIKNNIEKRYLFNLPLFLFYSSLGILVIYYLKFRVSIYNNDLGFGYLKLRYLFQLMTLATLGYYIIRKLKIFKNKTVGKIKEYFVEIFYLFLFVTINKEVNIKIQPLIWASIAFITVLVSNKYLLRLVFNSILFLFLSLIQNIYLGVTVNNFTAGLPVIIISCIYLFVVKRKLGKLLAAGKLKTFKTPLKVLNKIDLSQIFPILAIFTLTATLIFLTLGSYSIIKVVIATLITIFSICILYKNNFKVGLLLQILFYSLYNFYNISKIVNLDLYYNLKAFSFMSSLAVFFVAHFYHYRKEVLKRDSLAFITHVINWLLLAVSLYIYVDIIPLKIPLLFTASIITALIARRALYIGNKRLYVLDSVVSNLFIFIAVLSLYHRSTNLFLVLLAFVLSSMLYLLNSTLIRDKITSRIGYIQSIIGLVLLVFTNFANELDFITNTSQLSLNTRSILLIIVFLALGLFSYISKKRTSFYRFLDNSFKCTLVYFISSLSFIIYLNHINQLWSPYLFFALQCPVVLYQNKYKNDKFRYFIYLITLTFSLVSWIFVDNTYLWKKIVYLLPNLLSSYTLIRFMYKENKITTRNIIGYIIALINIVAFTFILFNNISPIIAPSLWLLLSIVFYKSYNPVKVRVSNIEYLTGLPKSLLYFSFILIGLFLVRYIDLLISNNRTLVSSFHIYSLALFGLLTLAYNTFRKDLKEIKENRILNFINSIFLEITLTYAIFTILLEVETLWLPTFFAILSLVTLLYIRKDRYLYRLRLYALIFYLFALFYLIFNLIYQQPLEFNPITITLLGISFPILIKMNINRTYSDNSENPVDLFYSWIFKTLNLKKNYWLLLLYNLAFTLTVLFLIDSTITAIISATIITVISLFLTPSYKKGLNRTAIIIVYTLFQISWKLRVGISGDLLFPNSMGLICYSIVFFIILFSQYSITSMKKRDNRLFLSSHLLNWLTLPLFISLYIEVIPLKIPLLIFGSFLSLLLAYKAKKINTPWLFISDSIAAKILMVVGIISLGNKGLDSFYITVLFFLESIMFLLFMIKEKERLFSKIYYLQCSLFGFIALLFSINYGFISSSVNNTIRSSILLLMAILLGFIYYKLWLKSTFFKAIDKLLKSVITYLICALIFASYITNYKEIWSGYALVLLFIPILYFREKLKSNLLLNFLFIISGLFTSLTIYRVWDIDRSFIIVYLVPNLLFNILLIKYSFYHRKKQYKNLPGFILLSINILLSVYLILNDISPFIIGLVYLLLSIGLIESSQYIVKKSNNYAFLENISKYIACLSFIMIGLSLLRHFFIHIYIDDFIGPFRIRHITEIITIAVLIYWIVRKDLLVFKNESPVAIIKKFLIEVLYLFVISTIIIEIEILWQPVIFASISLISLFINIKRDDVNRVRFYSLGIIWLSLLELCLITVFYDYEITTPIIKWLTGGITLLLNTVYIIAHRKYLSISNIKYTSLFKPLINLSLKINDALNVAIFYPYFTAIALYISFSFSNDLITLLLIIEGVIIFFVSMFLKDGKLKLLSMLELGGSLARLLLVDLKSSDYLTRAIVFISVGIIMVAMNIFYTKFKEKFIDKER